MSERFDFTKAAPEAVRPLYAAGNYLRSHTTLEAPLQHLVNLRVSQMNGCAFCLAMHWREAKETGVDDDRLNGLAAWREAPWYSERERAALEWAEGLTAIAEQHVPDRLFADVRAQFSERELVDLTLAVATINSWNRFAIAFRAPPESAAAVVRQLATVPG